MWINIKFQFAFYVSDFPEHLNSESPLRRIFLESLCHSPQQMEEAPHAMPACFKCCSAWKPSVSVRSAFHLSLCSLGNIEKSCNSQPNPLRNSHVMSHYFWLKSTYMLIHAVHSVERSYLNRIERIKEHIRHIQNVNMHTVCPCHPYICLRSMTFQVSPLPSFHGFISAPPVKRVWSKGLYERACSAAAISLWNWKGQWSREQ